MPEKAIDIVEPDEQNIMLYGEFASGKTTFATTFPKPILFLDVDQRHQTYAGVEGIEYIVYKDTGKRPKAFQEFMSDLRKYQTGSKYKTVVLDSTTTLLDILANDILGMTGKGRGATEGLDLAQWGTVTERFRRIFDIIRGYDTNTIVISHEQMFQDELTGELKRVVMMIGKKFPQRAPLFFDEIYRCYTDSPRGTDEVEYLIQTRSNRRYPARTSLNLRDSEGHTIPILEPVEPQDYPVIMEKIKRARANPEEFIAEVKKSRYSKSK